MSPLPLGAALLSAALLAGCASAGRPAPGGAPGPGGVALRFDWGGYQARVLMHRETRRSGRAPSWMVVRHLVVAEHRGDEIWISNRESEGQSDEEDLDLNLRIGEAVIQVVSRDGAFRRAEGLETALALLAERGLRDRDAARQSLSRLAAEDWEITVGAWQGRTLFEGQTLRKRFPGTLPLVPGVPVELEVGFGLAGRVPCEEGEEGSRCVALNWRAGPAPGELPEVTRRLQAGAGQGPDAARVEEVSARVEASLVAEPETLRPRRLEVREELRLRLRLPGGESREVVEETFDSYRFSREFDL
jgi:hypothetical protein